MATNTNPRDLVFGAHLCFSHPPRERVKAAEAFGVSFVFHIGIVVAAIWLSIAPPKREIAAENVLIPMLLEEEKPPPELPPPPPPPSTRTLPPDMTETPRGFQTLTVPTYISPEIPPPTVGAEIDEADYSGEGVEGGRARGRADPERVVSAEDISAAPSFTPYTAAPVLQNREEMARLLQRMYPALLRDAGLGGTVMMWIYIDAHGQVRNTRVKDSSGLAPLDSVAARVSLQMRFSPAQNRDVKVPVWVAVPVIFTVAR